MNPTVPPEMNWKDYTTTAVQWLSILGGIAVAIISGVKGNTGGLATGIGMAVAGLAGGKQGSLLEDSVRKIGDAMKGSGKMLMLLPLTLFLVSGCATSHPMLQPASLSSVLRVASPYLAKECKAIEVYAGYRLDWTPADPGGDPDFKNGFGGVLGGCDQYAKISCMVLPDKSVDCKVVQVLKALKE